MKKQVQLCLLVAILAVSTLMLSCEQVKQLPLIRSEKSPEYKISSCEAGIRTKLLRIGVLHPPLTFNPVTAFDQVSQPIAAQLTAGLYEFDPIQGTFEPALATGYDRDKENKLFTIHLRRNITFSDGIPFTADDVLTTINYILTPDVRTSLRAYLFHAGSQLEFSRVDDNTILCKSAQPLMAIEPVLCRILVLPARLIREASAQNRLERLYSLESNTAELPSIGPFIIKSYSPEEKKITLSRNERYWIVDATGQPLPYLEEVVATFTGTTTEMSIKFRTGESDIIDHVNPADAARLENIRGMKIFDVGPTCSTYVAWFNQNMKSDPKSRETFIPASRLLCFTNNNFRKAISNLFNREDYANDMMKGKAIPASSLLAPPEKDWLPALRPDSFSITAAKQILTDAGFTSSTGAQPSLLGPNKVPVSFSISVLSGDDFSEKLGVQMETLLGSAGIRATMVSLPYDLFYRKIRTDYDYDFVMMTLDAPAHPYFYKELLLSKSPGHLWYPEEDAPATELEKQMDAAIDELYGLTNWEKRYAASQKLGQLLDQGKFIIPIIKTNGLFGAKGKIRNLRVNYRCSSMLWNLGELYILEE